ncbi:MAG: hypothetical protein HY042_00540 [Spirochaetia bacterium]|nr:hypothetical protein [Spirochaetia bacterium]
MTYYAVNTGMTLSVIFFLLGYVFRYDRRKHAVLMIAAVLSNVAAALTLLGSVYIVYGGDALAAGFRPALGPGPTIAHRAAAAVAFILMFVQAGSGILKKPAIHKKLYVIFLPLYIVVYVSGLFVFEYSGGN